MQFDHWLVSFLNFPAGSSSVWDGAIIFFANYFSYLLAVLFLLFVVKLAMPMREKCILFFEGILAGLISRGVFVELIRFFIHRLRPFVADSTIIALISENSFSFPSGHAAFFFALSFVTYVYNKKWGIGFFLASIIIGFARVASGVHYPSDILGGAALGIAVGYLVVRVGRLLLKKNE